MNTVSHAHFTLSGLQGIGPIPYGTHACHFYSDHTPLADVLVPYMIAGLEARERCLWIAASPLNSHQAIRALRTAWSGANDAIDSGALHILDFDQWYMNASALKGPDLVEVWLKEEENALAEGYSGLRISGNTSFVTQNDWSSIMEYERLLNKHLVHRRIVALCSYARGKCSHHQRSHVIDMHNCPLEQLDFSWQVTPVPPLL